MSSQKMFLDTKYLNASSVQIIDSTTLTVHSTGTIPVELFNQIESQKINPQIRSQQAEPPFGTNIRDAARIIKEWRASSDATER